jgi:hypothetical protein
MDRTAASDAHDLTAKLAYELWERRGLRLAHLKLIGSLPRKLWIHPRPMRKRRFPYTPSRWIQTKSHCAECPVPVPTHTTASASSRRH